LKSTFLIIISLWFISLSLATAQTTIIDPETKQPIPFVQVVNLRAKAGVLSDENGIFTLPNTEKSDTILFSSIGYESKKVLAQNIDKQVFISPKALVLNEAIVRPTRTDKVFINKNKKILLPPYYSFTSGEGKTGFEIGRLIPTNCTGCDLTKISLFFGHNCVRGAKARLHIYNYDAEKDCPGKELLQQNVYIISDGHNKWVDIDLSKQQIKLYQDKIVVGVEFLIGDVGMSFGLTSYEDPDAKFFSKVLGNKWFRPNFLMNQKDNPRSLMVKLELN
jgi:hypothetical protein